MRTAKKIARNSSIFVAGNVLFRLISVIITIYLARYLGVSEFGKYSIVFAYLAFFYVFSDLGIRTILVREIAREKYDIAKIIGNAYLLRIFLTLIAFTSSVLLVNLLSYPEDIQIYTYIGAFTIFFISFNDFYATAFEANLRIEYSVIGKIVSKISAALLILWIIFAHGTLAQVMIALVVAETVKLLITFYFSRRFIRPALEFDLSVLKYLVKEAFPLALLGIIIITSANIGIILLSKMANETSVGIFSAAEKIITTLWILPAAFNVSLFPIMSSFHGSKRDKLGKVLHLGLKYVFIATLPVVVGVSLLGERFIILIYGEQFAGSGIVLSILIWGFFLGSVSALSFNALISVNRQNLVTFSYLIATISNVILNITLIPRFAHIGTALAALSSSLIFFMLTFYFVTKNIERVPLQKLLLKPTICSLLMGAFVYYFSSLNLFLIVPLAGVVYLVALFALRTLSAEEIAMIKSVFPIKF